MKIGYARVSTARQGQSLDTQREALIDAGCDSKHIYADTISGTCLLYTSPSPRD